MKIEKLNKCNVSNAGIALKYIPPKRNVLVLKYFRGGKYL